MRNRILNSKSGFTLLEVLIASVVFMIGFSLVVILLNSTLVKLSLKEITLTNSIGEEYMDIYSICPDNSELDTTITRSGIKFHIKRQIQNEDMLSKVHLVILREKTDKKLLELYDEIFVFQK